MQITVIEKWCGRETTISVESDEVAIYDLKLEMQKIRGFPIGDQDLYYCGTHLQDFELLKDHGLYDGAELEVRLTYWLIVHGPNEAYRLLVHKHLTLGQVKEILTDEHDLDMNNTTFIFGDETVNSGLFEKLVLGRKPPKTYFLEDDDATLEELGIRAETYLKFINNED